MSDTLKQVLELAKLLDYQDNETLRTALYRINSARKDASDREAMAIISA